MYVPQIGKIGMELWEDGSRGEVDRQRLSGFERNYETNYCCYRCCCCYCRCYSALLFVAVSNVRSRVVRRIRKKDGTDEMSVTEGRPDRTIDTREDGRRMRSQD